MSKAKTVEGYIADLSSPQQEIAETLRELIGKTAPNLEETIKWGSPCFMAGSANVCSIMAFKGHVNLAFFRGAELSDNDGLLEGTGKGMRHVKVKAVKEIKKQAITALVKEAAMLE